MEINSKVPRFGIRHIQVLCTFFVIFTSFMLRVNMSIAILAMTEEHSPNPNIPVYDWDNKSIILSSFFWAYVILQMLAAPLGRKYGTKNILLIVMFIDATAFTLIPFVADKLGSYGVICCRFVEGLAQGFIYPSVFNILGQWVPPSERSFLSNIMYLGGPIGLVLTPPISGYICSSWVGWPVTFYILGAVSYIWIIIFFIFTADSPSKYKSISIEEKNYIETSLAISENPKDALIPWKAIFTSTPAWSVILTSIGMNWGFTLVMTQFPHYLDKVMNIPLDVIGFITGLPIISTVIVSLLCSMVGDYIISNHMVSRVFVRKFSTTLGLAVPSISLIVLTYLPVDAIGAAVGTKIVYDCFNAILVTGSLVSHMDLSPNFCGVLMGIANCFGALAGIFAPLTVQFIVTEESNQAQWRIVFGTTALIRSVSIIFFIIFASGELQPWNAVIIKQQDKTPEDRIENTTENKNM